MRRLLAMTLKELRQASRDPLSLGLLVALPAFMLLLYGYALSFDVKHVPLALQDSDRTAASRDLAATFVESTYFDVVADLPANADLPLLLERREAKAVLVVPEGYGAELAAGRHGRVQMLVDGTDAVTANTVLAYAGALVEGRNGLLLAETLSAPGRPVGPPLDVRSRVWFNPDLKSTQFLVPGLIGFILMLTAVVSTAMSVVREKERGTMEQLRVTAIRPGEIIVGKVLPYLGLSLLAAAGILLAARVLFDVEVKGPYLHLFVATFVYLLGALGWGLFVSTLAESQAMAFQIGTVSSMLPAIFLSGFIFPISSMPAALQVVTYAVPARYYLVILRGVILKGAGLGPYAWDLVLLCAYAGVVLALAWRRLMARPR